MIDLKILIFIYCNMKKYQLDKQFLIDCLSK